MKVRRFITGSPRRRAVARTVLRCPSAFNPARRGTPGADGRRAMTAMECGALRGDRPDPDRPRPRGAARTAGTPAWERKPRRCEPEPGPDIADDIVRGLRMCAHVRTGRLCGRERMATRTDARCGKPDDDLHLRTHGRSRRIPLRQFVRPRTARGSTFRSDRGRARAAAAVPQRSAGGGAGPRPRVARRPAPRRRYSPATRCPTAPSRWRRPTPATSSAGSRRNSAMAARCCSAR